MATLLILLTLETFESVSAPLRAFIAFPAPPGTKGRGLHLYHSVRRVPYAHLSTHRNVNFCFFLIAGYYFMLGIQAFVSDTQGMTVLYQPAVVQNLPFA